MSGKDLATSLGCLQHEIESLNNFSPIPKLKPEDLIIIRQNWMKRLLKIRNHRRNFISTQRIFGSTTSTINEFKAGLNIFQSNSTSGLQLSKMALLFQERDSSNEKNQRKSIVDNIIELRNEIQVNINQSMTNRRTISCGTSLVDTTSKSIISSLTNVLMKNDLKTKWPDSGSEFLEIFDNHTKDAKKHFFSLLSQFGKFYTAATNLWNQLEVYISGLVADKKSRRSELCSRLQLFKLWSTLMPNPNLIAKLEFCQEFKKIKCRTTSKCAKVDSKIEDLSCLLEACVKVIKLMLFSYSSSHVSLFGFYQSLFVKAYTVLNKIKLSESLHPQWPQMIDFSTYDNSNESSY